ncbi:hypothetical protein [Nocardia lijiangensis]|uniref:hypothetical protein n=1 Tax=Nocardia lijiangensis TaxID=299618 RepID=UPI0012DEF662|nr:hypothetical protein [Nocardia lijiangensis]
MTRRIDQMQIHHADRIGAGRLGQGNDHRYLLRWYRFGSGNTSTAAEASSKINRPEIPCPTRQSPPVSTLLAFDRLSLAQIPAATPTARQRHWCALSVAHGDGQLSGSRRDGRTAGPVRAVATITRGGSSTLLITGEKQMRAVASP